MINTERQEGKGRGGGPLIVRGSRTEREVLTISSVGILMHYRELSPRRDPLFLLVEQIDIEGHPWGIPAGRTEEYEADAKETAVREALEETSLEIDPKRLKPFLQVEPRDKPGVVELIYSYQLTGGELRRVGKQQWSRGIGIISRGGNRESEIGRLAIVSRDRLFERGNPITGHLYRWDFWSGIKAKLEGLRVI